MVGLAQLLQVDEDVSRPLDPSQRGLQPWDSARLVDALVRLGYVSLVELQLRCRGGDMGASTNVCRSLSAVRARGDGGSHVVVLLGLHSAPRFH